MKSPQEQRETIALTPGEKLALSDLDALVERLDAEDYPSFAQHDTGFPAGHYRLFADMLRDYQRLILSELALPEGWVAVPREPDAVMHARLTNLGRALVSDAHERDQWCWFAIKAYRAMIEAISTLPGGGVGNSVSQSQPKSTLHGAHTEAELSGAFDPVAFGESLRRVMGAKGLSVRKAAPLIGASPATINRVMRGNPPNVEDYLRICKWLSPSVAEGL